MPVVAAFIGAWSAAFTGDQAVQKQLAIVSSLTVLPQCGPIDWLLVETSIGRTLVADVAEGLNGWGSRRPRVAVLDVHGIWPSAAACDVYQAVAATPDDLWATMFLSMRGYQLKIVAPRRSSELPEAVAALTQREIQMLRALGTGLTNDQIARRMSISRSTVEFHCTNIFRKLGVSSRVEASLVAHQHLYAP
jgi:DNA-binding CsgD family transcriptional regulator